MSATPSLGSLQIDLPKLLETRALIQANSGAGKSWCLRRLLEQTVGHVQQLVIDPEGEFATLRERFDYIVCAPAGADAVATPQTAAALARALWQAGTSAILDIYDLKAHERVLFVRRFLEALVNAPRALWHPTLVVVDEVHTFCPQVGSAESGPAVIDLATRGRKRGLALVGATQRLSKLHKDCAAELLNKLIGRTGLDVDVQRAADELGFASKRDAVDKLRNMEPGEFYAYGPALSRAVTLTTIGPVVTTHPETGHRTLTAPPPPSPKLLAQLAKLEGIQRETERQAQSEAELRAEVAQLKRKLTIAEKAKEREDDIAALIKANPPPIIHMPPAALSSATLKAVEKAIAALQALREPAPPPAQCGNQIVSSPAPAVARQHAPVPAAPQRAGSAEQRVLDAISWWLAAGVDTPTRHQVAFVAGYTVNGHFNNVCGTLRSRGLVEYPGGGTLRLTLDGTAHTRVPNVKPGRQELVDRIAGVLKGEPQRRLFMALVQADAPLPRAELAARCGYTENGHFNNLCGALKSLGLVDYPTKGAVGLTPVVTGVR